MDAWFGGLDADAVSHELLAECGVSLSFPDVASSQFLSYLGCRLIYWPCGRPTDSLVSVISSRIGRRADLHPEWFDVLRTLVLRASRDRECLAYSTGTAAADYVRRACELFGVSRLRIEVDEGCVETSEQLVEWMEHQSNRKHLSESEQVALVSPRYAGPERDSNSEQLTSTGRDTALVLAGDRIVALRVAPSGNIERLLAQVLSEPRFVPILVAVHERTEATIAEKRVISAGAVPWILKPSMPLPRVTGLPPQLETVRSDLNGNEPLESPDDWLCHWTRARKGAWFDQPEDDYLDELILGCESADRAAFAALLKILEHRKIYTSTSGSPSATVSFTAVPLTMFRGRRVFRRHKRQYDFEQYGIAVRRSVIEGVGGRPVEYVPRRSNTESNTDCHYDVFQQPITNDAGTIDWRAEREWRLEGNLDLSSLSGEDVVVFANTPGEVARLAGQCDWPVIHVPEADV